MVKRIDIHGAPSCAWFIGAPIGIPLPWLDRDKGAGVSEPADDLPDSCRYSRALIQSAGTAKPRYVDPMDYRLLVELT